MENDKSKYKLHHPCYSDNGLWGKDPEPYKSFLNCFQHISWGKVHLILSFFVLLEFFHLVHLQTSQCAQLKEWSKDTTGWIFSKFMRKTNLISIIPSLISITLY